MKANATHTCLSCNNHFRGKYCNNCGEKVLTEHDKTISHLLHEAFHFLTHFDNKFFRSLKLIFVQPGLVAREFSLGKQKKYYSPFSMFLLAIFLYLLFPTLQGLNINFYAHLSNNNAIGMNFPERWAAAKAYHEGISVDELAGKFDHISPKIAKVCLILLVPLTALALAIIFRRKKRFFYDHFIYASEYLSFFVFYIFFLLPLFFKLLNVFMYTGDIGDSNLAFVLIQVTGLWLISISGLKRFYNLTRMKSIFLSLLFLLMLSFIAFFLYRWIIFAIVMLFV